MLRSMDYGEADLILTYITLDMGIRKAFAKSARKVKSRFGGSLEPLTHARITLMGKEDASLPRLTQSDIIRPFQGLRESYGCFVRLCSMVELTEGLVPEGVDNKPAFAFMLRMMQRMEEGCSVLDGLVYRVRLLKLKGYALRVEGCTRCGSGASWFYPSVGSTVCERCAMIPNVVLPQDRKLRLLVSQGVARFYEALCAWEIDKTARLKVSPAMMDELVAIVDAHVEYLLSRPLRSRLAAASMPVSS